VSVLDGILNAYFALLALLFITGGYVPAADRHREFGLAVDMWQMNHWVLGFLALVIIRRLCDRRGTFGEIAFVRVLRGIAVRLAASPRIVYVVTSAWILLLFATAARIYWAFGDTRDLEVFDQALWNTTQGHFYRSSLVGDVNLFSEHFDPLNLLLVAFYFVNPSPLILLAAQSIMLGLGAIPLYWLARERFPGHVLAALFPILYLFYLPVREANRFGYHPGALVPPLFLFALYFMEKSRWGWMVFFLALAGLLKENMPIAGVVIGIYLFLAARQRVLGGALVAVFGLWFYAGFAWIIPAFGPISGGYKYFDLFTRLEASPSGMFLAPLLNPSGVAAALTAYVERKIYYLLQVFGPLGFLSFLSPSRLFLGLPFLAPHLLSDIRLLTTIRTHHTADLTPFVFYSALWGADNLLRWLSGKDLRGRSWGRESLARALAVLLLSTSFVFHGWPEPFQLRRYAITPHRQRLHEVLDEVPRGVSVSTQRSIAPHLSHRRALYRFQEPGPAGREPPEPPEVVVLDRSLIERNTYRKAFEEGVARLGQTGYEKIRDEDSILVFRRVPAGRTPTGESAGAPAGRP
jgi:uncharacterized membrane protein